METLNKQETNPPLSKFFINFCFFNLGICCLLSYNFILATLAFFCHYQGKHEPHFYYPYYNFLINLPVQFYLTIHNSRHHNKTKIFLACFIMLFVMICLPLSTIYLGEDYGFYTNCVLITLLGSGIAICLNSTFSLASKTDLSNIIAVSTGVGFAGITANVIQYIVLLSVNFEDKVLNLTVQVLIYYSVFCLFIFFLFWLMNKMYDDPVIADKAKIVIDEFEKANVLNNLQEIIRTIPDLLWLMISIYFVTFVNFPGVFILQPFLFHFKQFRKCKLEN